MQKKVVNFFIYTAVFYNELIVICAKTLVGSNVKHVVAQSNQYSSVVCILKMKRGYTQMEKNVRCAGTLITYEHVITAENCFYDLGSSYLEVAVGSVDLYKAVIFNPIWWLTYDGWAKNNEIEINYPNDIAITKLKDQVCHTFNNINLPVLSNLQQSRLDGLKGLIVGWGLSNERKRVHSMEKVTVIIKTYDSCQSMIKHVQKKLNAQLAVVPKHMICSLAIPYAHMSKGDRGGPIFYGDVLLAVNNGLAPKSKEFDADKLNIHTDITYYKTFIDYCINI